MEPDGFHIDWIGGVGFLFCVLGVGIFELNSERRGGAIIGIAIALAGCALMLVGTR